MLTVYCLSEKENPIKSEYQLYVSSFTLNCTNVSWCCRLCLTLIGSDCVHSFHISSIYLMSEDANLDMVIKPHPKLCIINFSLCNKACSVNVYMASWQNEWRGFVSFCNQGIYDKQWFNIQGKFLQLILEWNYWFMTWLTYNSRFQETIH